MPVRTVTVASVAASTGSDTNCPTTSRVSAVAAYASSAASTTGLNSGEGVAGGSRTHTASASGNGREPRQLAERDQPHQRDRERRAHPPARQAQRGGDAARAQRRPQLRPRRGRERPHRAPAHDEVQPRHRQRLAEPLEHHHRGAREAQRAGDRVQRRTGPEGIGRGGPQGGREQRSDEPRTTTRDGRGHTREAAKDEHRAGRLYEHQCRYNRTGPAMTNGPDWSRGAASRTATRRRCSRRGSRSGRSASGA